MIDNIKHITPLLNFTDPNDFYMLYVLKRKKDMPAEDLDNRQSVRTIKTYCIESIDHLEERYDEIKQLCEMFKARAYIHVQKQNHQDVSLNMMIALAEKIKNGQHNQKGLFDSTVGQLKTSEKRWIVDIDTKDEIVIHRAAHIIYELRPEGSKIESIIPTKNGYHLITTRFDTKEFVERMKPFGEIPDIQRKNPTLLYYPESLNL